MADIIADLISEFDPANPNFRPTEVFNEGWLLKALLYRIEVADLGSHPLGFLPGASWFSGALLPSAFRARHRGDPLAEARTNADGVIGHIVVGDRAKADLHLAPAARQFCVVEAKIRSPLSSGTANAPFFDQAVRNVACMAEVLRQADIPPATLDPIAFIVLAPAASIDAGLFSEQMSKSSMQEKVSRRIEAYEGEMDTWRQDWFQPTLDAVDLQSLSWETAISTLEPADPEGSNELRQFYGKCLQFN